MFTANPWENKYLFIKMNVVTGSKGTIFYKSFFLSSMRISKQNLTKNILQQRVCKEVKNILRRH